MAITFNTLFFYSIIYVIFYVVACHASTAELKIPRSPSDSIDVPSYFPEQALKLALQKTIREYGETELKYVDDFYSADRLRAMLVQNNGLDVMWSNVTRERENAMLSVNFNVLRGINEYRLLMVKKENENIFEHVTDKNDLRLYKVGIGSSWADRTAFDYNAMNIVLTPSADSMFKMLAAGRMDYLTRSVHEIDFELERFEKYGFTKEKNIMLRYCLPIHYYVRKDNVALAERIAKGIKLAIADGTLDRLYWSVPAIRQAHQYVVSGQWHIIKLPVPECAIEPNW